MRTLLALLISALALKAAGFTADSARGARLFETLNCVQCHSVNGPGAKVGPDLGRMLDRGFTPATLAATMWNHAPGMWTAMRDRQISPGQFGAELDEQGARDLMAFFYAARFFEKPGDAGRGKRAFENHGCQGCHTAAAARQWTGLGDSIALASAMWNHRAEMQAASASKGRAAPEISAQDLTDILVYLRNQPGNQPGEASGGTFQIEATGAGEALFQSSGCAKCHQTVPALAAQVQGKTLTEIAAEMWNHAPRMAAAGAAAVQLSPAQMRDLVSAFWAAKFFADSGRASAGAHVFAAKNCTLCHNDAASGAPHLPAAGREWSGASMMSVLWRHGPRMLDQMKSKNLPWPRFDGSQMADLIAYLNSPTTPGRP